MSQHPNDAKPPLTLNTHTTKTAPETKSAPTEQVAVPAPASKRVVTRERMRPSTNDGTQSAFAINPDRIPDDVEYRWVRVMIGEKEDNDNYDKALIDGWLEVPASRHPELVLNRLGRDKVTDDAPILRKGHVLMDIPKQYAADKRARQRQENVARVQSIEHTLLEGTAPTQFFTEQNSVTTSKGVSFQS